MHHWLLAPHWRNSCTPTHHRSQRCEWDNQFRPNPFLYLVMFPHLTNQHETQLRTGKSITRQENFNHYLFSSEAKPTSWSVCFQYSSSNFFTIWRHAERTVLSSCLIALFCILLFMLKKIAISWQINHTVITITGWNDFHNNHGFVPTGWPQ